MKSDYFGYLRDSGQEETAAELKAQEGDYVTAINLYLKGGYPARAASIVKQHDVRSGGQQLQERIANELTRAGMHERAGEFYELLGKYSKRRRSNVAVIPVRVVFIGSFLFYCLLLNHSFQTNPNKITNCFKLFSLLQLYNYICSMRSLF